jgi:hypothetical protein
LRSTICSGEAVKVRSIAAAATLTFFGLAAMIREPIHPRGVTEALRVRGIQ